MVRCAWPTPATVSSRTTPLAETATVVAVFKVVDFITMFRHPTKKKPAKKKGWFGQGFPKKPRLIITSKSKNLIK